MRETRPEDVRAEPGGRGHDVLVVHGTDGAHRRGARERVPAVGHPSRVRASGERLVDGVAHEHPTERHGTGVHALREDQEVGSDSVVVDAEPAPGTAEAGEHLVRDEDDPVLGAQLADPAQVAGRRHDHPRAAGHGFQDQARDRRRTLEQDHLLEVGERSLALLLRCARPERRAVEERAEEVDGARRARVRRPPARVTGQVDRGRRGSVVRAVGGQHLRSTRVKACQPHRVLDGLRTARGEEHVTEADRGHLHDQPRRLATDVRGMAGRQRAQPVRLLPDRRHDARVLVTQVGEDQLGREVQVAATVGVVDVAARAAHEGGDGARPLHRPGVEHQLVQVHRTPRASWDRSIPLFGRCRTATSSVPEPGPGPGAVPD